MAYGFVFPVVNVRDVTRKVSKHTITGKRARGNPTAKYDHWQMLMDRLEGMTWCEIGIKHNVKAASAKFLGATTQNLALNSKATLKLSPAQVKRLEEI